MKEGMEAGCPFSVDTDAHHPSNYDLIEYGVHIARRGWATADRCRFAVALRGGIVRGDRARLFAGAGIVETSDPAAELAETEAKLDLMRGILA